MASGYIPDIYETNPSEPVPGMTPWRDANGIWHFGGEEASPSHAGGNGAGVPGRAPSSPPTPPVVPPGGGSPSLPGGGTDIASLITQLGGGLLSGLGQMFGQQRRNSFSGTEADPVQALSGVQRRISGFGDTMGQRATAPVSLSGDSGVRRNTSTQPNAQDLEQMKQTLRSMGVTL